MALFLALIAIVLICVSCTKFGYNNGYEDGKYDEELEKNYRDNDEINELRREINRLLGDKIQLKNEIDKIKEEYELMRGTMLDSMVKFEVTLDRGSNQ